MLEEDICPEMQTAINASTQKFYDFLDTQHIPTEKELIKRETEHKIREFAEKYINDPRIQKKFVEQVQSGKIVNTIDLSEKNSSNRKYNRNKNIIDTTLGKIPPQSIEEEEKLLSILFQHPELLKKLPNQAIKQDGFFFYEHNQIVAKAILRRRGNTNRTTITSELRKKEELEMIGGRKRLNELFNFADNKDLRLFDEYYQQVEKTYNFRKIIRMAEDIGKKAFEENPFFDKIEIITGEERYRPERKKLKESADQTFVDVYRVLSEAFMDAIPYPYKIDFNLDDIIDEAFDEITSTIKRKGLPEISTGIKEIDRFTHGFRRGRTGIIAGGSKVGKTTLITSLADKVMEQKGGVLLFTYESKPYEIIHKLIAKRSKVNLSKYEYYDPEVDPFTKEEQKRVFATKKELKKLPFHIEGGTPDVDYIIRYAKYQKILNPNLKLVVIDGIQSFSDCVPDKETKAEFYYKTINRFSKEIAEYLGLQVIITGQLKRIATKNKLPRHMDDIADCKGLGDVADWAFALYQENELSVLKGIPLSARQDEKPKKHFELHAQRNLGYIGPAYKRA
jgi:replicative DNA helicase